MELDGEPAARAAQALTSRTTSAGGAMRLCHGISSWRSGGSAPLLLRRGRVPAGAGGVLMRVHDGGVDRDVPVDLTGRIRHGLNLLEQVLPGSVGRPQPMTLIGERDSRASPLLVSGAHARAECGQGRAPALAESAQRGPAHLTAPSRSRAVKPTPRFAISAYAAAG